MPAARVRIRALDISIFLLALIIIGLISLQTYVRGGGTPEITIEAAGVPAAGVPAAGAPAAGRSASGHERQWIFPLDAQTTLRVPGPLGDTVVVIENGSVRVVSSPCPEKICIKTGRISKPGQWIACLPNKVFISIRGRRSEQPDAISQ
jgi:hypothetical protein